MLFIPSSLTDGTCDILVGLLSNVDVPVFRWNVDLFEKYEVRFDANSFIISDPLGLEVELFSEEVFLLYRKPFADMAMATELSLSEDDLKFAQSEIRQIVRTASSIFEASGRRTLIDPFAEMRLPKLVQLRLAAKYFEVPEYSFSILENHIEGKVISKALGDLSVGENKIFYTTEVDQSTLFRPYPWFIQKSISSGVDITCVFIDGICSFYQCGFKRSTENIDWRVEIGLDNQSPWEAIELEDIYSENVKKFMLDARLQYGRLDFILSNGTLYFLECNSNGQFGWLDDEDLRLHKTFANAALRNTTIYSNILV